MSEGRFLKLVESRGWEFVIRKASSGVAAIIPITDRGEIVLVEEYRHPLNKLCISVPAGLVGDEAGSESESPETAAQRELIEESGYRASDLRFLAESPTSPGLTDETISFFLATGLTQVNEGGGVDGEEIRVHVVALAEIDSWVIERTAEGFVFDNKFYAALYFARLET
jgi:ADP-ribose pyrophosphatase